MVEGLSLDILCVLDLGSRGEAMPEGGRAVSGVPVMVFVLVIGNSIGYYE